MQIQLTQIKIRDVIKGYINSDENGAFAYGVDDDDIKDPKPTDGKNPRLIIRPPYQREFVYRDEQRNEVIRTILKNFPLNIMYWVKNDNQDKECFELLDGQQRTISICEFVAGNFSVANSIIGKDPYYFHNLPTDWQDKVLDYELQVYICTGEPSEKLDWFKVINIAGEKLTDQELRNAIYHGAFVSDAKRYFSKNGNPAQSEYGDFLKGSAIRQEYLQTALKWAAYCDKTNIENYMARHQNDKNASELWQYFEEIFAWVKRTFKNQEKSRLRLMKGLEWGEYYHDYQDKKFNADELEQKIKTLIGDSAVAGQKGIYEYLLSGDEKHLNLRGFDDEIRQKAYQKQNGICVHCVQKFEIDEMEADHITPWSRGGKTVLENCQMLCKGCNRRKGGK